MEKPEKKKEKYQIAPGFEGLVVGATPPTYERKDGGKFVLNESLSQKDRGYLYEVLQYPGIVIAE